MKSIALLLFLVLSFAGAARAELEPDYNPEMSPGAAPWYEDVSVASQKRDLNFITGMRPHHAGALSMSKEYLANKNAQNRALRHMAKAIMHNQQFEIGMLDTVEGLLKKVTPPASRAQVAIKGLAQAQKFQRMPSLSAAQDAGNVSKEDVRFAKAMVIHHQGAVDMCRDYHADKSVRNGYLGLFCVDVIRDQTREINYMNRIVSHYKGNPDDVKIDPSMVHGMDGMMHHMGGHH